MLFVPREVSRPPFRDLPVYMQEWLTELSAGCNNTQKTVIIENGKPLGSFAFSLRRNGIGMKQGYNLPWARLNGVSISEDVSETRRVEITRQLIRQLPKNVSLFLTLANELDYKLFLSEGFESIAEENYSIAPDRLKSLFDSFSKMTKRHIKQAERDLIVSTTTPEAFIAIYEADLARRGRRPYAPLGIAREILTEGLRRGQARIFTANRRDTREVEATIACLWDDERYYYWMTTRRLPSDDQIKPHPGAIKLLLWSAIQDAATKGLHFDFDGAGTDSSHAGKTRLYSGLGAQLSVRYAVTRETKLERILGHFRQPVKFLLRMTFGKLKTLKINLTRTGIDRSFPSALAPARTRQNG
jgi:hypothetical protein